MPQIDIYYSNDLNINSMALSDVISKTINDFDGPRDSVIRMYPAAFSNKANVFINIGLLPRSHRDDNYQQQLIKLLQQNIKEHLSQPCYLAINITWLNNHYQAETLS